MTREETIVNLEKLIALFHTASEQSKMVDYSKIIETLNFAAAALHPVSREQVEKVWRGEWNNINPAVLKPGVSWVCRCAKCGCPQDYKHNFCPNCGAAQTDEAVQMVMERLEALYDTEN